MALKSDNSFGSSTFQEVYFVATFVAKSNF